jgi:hypothetical protein
MKAIGELPRFHWRDQMIGNLGTSTMGFIIFGLLLSNFAQAQEKRACVPAAGTPIHVNIQYGERPDPESDTSPPQYQHILKVHPKRAIIRRSCNHNRLVFRLQPTPANPESGFRGKNVAVIGVRDDSGMSTNTGWLIGVGNVQFGDATIEIDIDDDVPDGDYKYMVIVPGVGIIDPHVKVEN